MACASACSSGLSRTGAGGAVVVESKKSADQFGRLAKLAKAQNLADQLATGGGLEGRLQKLIGEGTSGPGPTGPWSEARAYEPLHLRSTGRSGFRPAGWPGSDCGHAA